MKIIFMGTPEFAVSSLEAIIEQGHEILLVISQKDKPKGRGKKLTMPPVIQKAKELGLKTYQPQKIKDEESVSKLKKLEPDLIIVTAYGQILSKEILDIPKLGCINVHASLLPKYRGAAPINFALINGEKTTGITTMYMEEGLDTGDILLKDTLQIEQEDTAITLFEKLAKLSKKTLKDTLKLASQNQLNPIPQQNDKATYTNTMSKELGHINWDQPAEEIINLWKGTKPWPGVYGIINGQTVKFDCLQIGEKQTGQTGEIVQIAKDHISVMAKDTSIKIYCLQYPNKKLMPVSEYLKGNTVEKSSIIQ